MSKKRLFQILDDMNVADGENKTTHVQVCPDFVKADKVKHGGHITMGVPPGVVEDIAFKDDKILVLLIIDRNEYKKLQPDG